MNILYLQNQSILCEFNLQKYTDFIFTICKFEKIIILLTISIQFMTIPITLYGFMFIQKWKNPAKIYYYIIISTMAVIFVFVDICKIMMNNLSYLTNNAIDINLLKKTIFNFQIICPFFTYIKNTATYFDLWVMAIFSTHRMFIVVLPMKKNTINKIFLPWMIIIIIFFVTINQTPYFITSVIDMTIQRRLCALYTVFDPIWFAITQNIDCINLNMSMLLIVFSFIIICTKLTIASIERKHLINMRHFRNSFYNAKTNNIL